MPSGSTPDPSALRVAVVGLGRMGVRHVQAVRALGMTVCGVADLSEAALDSARESHGLAADALFTDAGAMLRATRPDGVVVATTAPSHAALVEAACDAGARYVLCEKPMATSLAEVDAMRASADRAGAALAVNHQMRFMPQYTRVRELIGSEELGPLASVLVAGSNFGLAMNASHYFEMFRYVSGSRVASVQAWFEPGELANPRGAQFEDRSGRLLARGEDGTAMFIDFSADAGYGLQVVYVCRFGQVVVDELSGDVRVAARQAQYRELPTTRYGMPADVRTFAIEPADTVVPTVAVWRAMLAGEGYPDADAGAHALGCLVAAHASHEAGGREVRLDDPSLPRDRRFPWA